MPVPNQLPISVVGVYPKPSYLPIPTWYVDGVADESFNCDKYEEYISSLTEIERVNLDKCLQKAQKEVSFGSFPYYIPCFIVRHRDFGFLNGVWECLS
mgnify:CR=1 FL=1